MQNHHISIQGLTVALTMLWGSIASIIFIMLSFSIAPWIASALVIVGIITSISIRRKALAMQAAASAIPALSKGSVCVWQLDREA